MNGSQGHPASRARGILRCREALVECARTLTGTGNLMRRRTLWGDEEDGG